MKKRITFKKVIRLLLVAVLLFGAYTAYNSYLAPTKVGLINYPDFLCAKISKSNENSFIMVDNLSVDSLPDNLDSYDMLLVFGMGLRLPASEEQKIRDAAKKGVSMYLQASTNPRLQLTNLEGEILDNIDDYLDNGGRKNYKNMLNYIRVKVDGKTFKTDTIIAPKPIPADVLFHIDEDAVFKEVEDFEAYCTKNKMHKKGQDNVVLFTSVPGPFNANREHLNSLIQELQNRNLNVYPIAGFKGRIDYMQKIKPKLIVYMPHGRLSLGGSPKAMEKWLKKQNIPILCPVTVYEEYDKWLKDKMGLFGRMLSQSVTMPEFDGGIVPYAVFAQEKDKNGLLLFKAIPDRLKKFGDIVKNYLALPKKKNADKKIAIVYFKGPGKNALVAANLEVLPSLHNTLLQLQKEGYNLGDLPKDFKSFKARVMSEGPVLGPYAVGAFEKYLKSGKPELVPAETYNQWRKETLPQELIDDMDTRYGKAPGAYMGVSRNAKDYLAIARVKFGNVVILPQPLPGIGDNEFALVHGAKVAPPHPYVGAYLWIQKGFKADAVFHFGTHGSLEFTPGKQIALSQYDWTDPLIGTTPHFYVYTISNVGEGMIAKRRSYTVTQTYLTPPFIKAQAFNKRAVMHEKLHKYEQAKGALKTQYALSIKKLAVKEGIHKDLDLDSILTKPYNDEEMLKLANYIEEVEHEKVTGGLYTMGVPYSPKHLSETMQLMMVDALAYSLADIDAIKGKITRKQMEDKHFFNNKYTERCEPYTHKVMRTKNPDKVFAELVSKADLKRATDWQKAKAEQNAKMYGRRGMQAHQSAKKADEKIQLRDLIIKISPDKEKRKFIEKLESKKEYERALSLLNPKEFARAAKMAKFIPAMKKALQTASSPDIKAILKLIKKEEMRQLALKYLNDKGLADEVAKETAKQHEMLLQKALSKEMIEAIAFPDAKITAITLPQLQSLKTKLDFYNANKKIFLAMPKAQKNQQLSAFLKDKLAGKLTKTSFQIKKLENKENNFAEAVFKVKAALKSILVKKEALKNSPQKEFDAIVNSLNGGYTAPTTGGDPIANPETLPTGRNLVSVDAETTPTKEAWNVAVKLGDDLLADYRKKHNGKYPEKVSFTLWSSSFIESEGTTIGEILYLMGVQPVWNFFGKVTDIRIIPEEELKRPRIDVVVQTSGQLRDLAASRLFLINKAIAKVANEAKGENNYIKKGVADAEKRLIEKGYSPKEARNLSTKRVFGGVNGNYGKWWLKPISKIWVPYMATKRIGVNMMREFSRLLC